MEKLYKREDYLNKIRGFYDDTMIKVITGIRRCGKSYLYGIAFRQDWEGERGAADRIYHCFDIKKYRRCAEMGKGQNIGTR